MSNYMEEEMENQIEQQYMQNIQNTNPNIPEQVRIILEQQEINRMDDLINSFSYNTALVWRPKQHFINDIHLIVDEITKFHDMANVDIYEVLVSCGHSLTWDQEYYLSMEDLNWLKSEEGKKFFFDLISSKRQINMIEYNVLYYAFNKLVELFELQIQ